MAGHFERRDLFVYFFLGRIAGSAGNGPYTSWLLDLVPAAVIRGAVWQLVTYLFLHEPRQPVAHSLQHAYALDVRSAD